MEGEGRGNVCVGGGGRRWGGGGGGGGTKAEEIQRGGWQSYLTLSRGLFSAARF